MHTPRDRKREECRVGRAQVLPALSHRGVCVCAHVCTRVLQAQRSKGTRPKGHCGRVGIRTTDAVRLCVPLALCFNCSVPASYVCKQKRVASVTSTTGRSLAMSSRGSLGYVAGNKVGQSTGCSWHVPPPANTASTSRHPLSDSAE